MKIKNYSEFINEAYAYDIRRGLKYIKFLLSNPLMYQTPFYISFKKGTNEADVESLLKSAESESKDVKKMPRSYGKGPYGELVLEFEKPNYPGLTWVFKALDEFYGNNGAAMGWYGDIEEARKSLNEAAKYNTNKTHSDVAMYGLWLRNQIHLFHWQTEVGDAHKALGDFYDGFLGQLDGLIEVCMGKHGRVSATPAVIQPLQNLKDVNVEEFVNLAVSNFVSFRNDVYGDSPEIQNIVDEIIAEMHKLKYLLTMS